MRSGACPTMILLIDNYDSFVHNLARYVRELGGEARRPAQRRAHRSTTSRRWRRATSSSRRAPARRPRPASRPTSSAASDQRSPSSASASGISASAPPMAPTSCARAARCMARRRPSPTTAPSVFAGLPSPLLARPLSLAGHRPRLLPPELRVTASADDDGEIMAVEHVRHPVVGVQFHPESAASEYGYAMLDRFLHGERSRGTASAPARRRRS